MREFRSSAGASGFLERQGHRKQSAPAGGRASKLTVEVRLLRSLSRAATGTAQHYERCRASAAKPREPSLTTGRRGGNKSGPIPERFSTVPITGASSRPSA